MILLFIFSIPLHAATFTVTSLNDSGPGSLRQAVLDANASLTATHTIEFQPGLTGTITLVNGEIAITGRITINGPGENVLAVSGNNASRVFNISSLGATIRGLTIKEGSNVSHWTGSCGGGIHNTGYLTLSNLTLSGNAAKGGGGICNSGNLTLDDITLSDNEAPDHNGGGIYNSGSITSATRLTLLGNKGGGTNMGGGIFHGSDTPLTISNSIFTANEAGYGGGICNATGSTLTVTNSIFSDNTASQQGGGISNEGGILIVSNSVLSNNVASYYGAGINNSFRGYPATLTIINSTLSGNLSNFQGGGVFNAGTLTVTNSTVTGNMTIDEGGGIRNAGSSALTLSNSIVAGNTAHTSGNLSTDSGLQGGSNLFGENGVSGVTGATPSPSEIIAGPLSSVIGPLADNGGPTQTHALVAGSPAINAGNISLIPAGVTTDQRGDGFPRIVGGTVDIGAVEGTGGSVTTYALMVGKSGGDGTITSNPAGINCGSTCTGNFNSGTSVTLTANPDSGYSFNGWSGDCSGTNNNLCTVTMDRAKSVTALFTNQTLNTYTLTVSKAGNGSGTVTSNPVGIDCGFDCSESYAANTLVTLTAKPSSFDVKPLSIGSQQARAGAGRAAARIPLARSR